MCFPAFSRVMKSLVKKISLVDSPWILEDLSKQQRPDNQLTCHTAQLLPSKTIQFPNTHYLAYHTLDYLFFMAFPASPEVEQLGSWHSLWLAQQWHRYSFASHCTDVGFLILLSAGSRGAAEDPWQKWQEKRAIYPFSYPLPLPPFYLIMCPFAKLGPQAEGLNYKQLDSDTNFIRLPPHPVCVRSPVTSGSYDGTFFL